MDTSRQPLLLTLRWLYRLFKDMRLAALVIGLLIAMYFLGILTPQKREFQTRELYDAWVDKSAINAALDWLQFTDIYAAPVTVALLVVFFITLAVVTADRVPVLLRRMYHKAPPPEFGPEDVMHSPGAIRLKLIGQPDGAFEGYLKKRWWFVMHSSKPGALLAVKNRYSPVGFLLFHLCFIFCLLGGLTIMYTRFTGNLVLTEGQPFAGDMAQFRSINREPKFFKKLPSLGLMVKDVDARFEGNAPVEVSANMEVFYDGVTSTEQVRVNEPITRGPLSLNLLTVGVSPYFQVRGPSGNTLDAAFVSLYVLGGAEDSFVFDSDPSYKFKVKFHPDYVPGALSQPAASMHIVRPAVELLVEKGGFPVYEGTLEMGQFAQMGPYSVGFTEVRKWAELQVIREYGGAPLVIGLFLGAVGLLMRLVFYQRTLRAALVRDPEGSVMIIYMDGRSEFFRYTFDEELRMLAHDMASALGAEVMER